jgi:glycosyltransferase involved in cell wall biosynthesis
VPNGIDTLQHLRLTERTRQLWATLALDQASPRLLLPARLTPRKNVGHALAILSELRRAMPEAMLIVTGPPGPHNPANAAYLDELRRRRAELGVEDAALFLGEICEPALIDEEMGEWFGLSDALLFPSREEGFGIPLLEAGLHRLPVFAADIPQLREIGGSDVTWFPPDGEPGAIAGAIQAQLEGDPRYAMAIRARQHDWRRVYAEHVEPLLQAVA